MKRAIFTLVVVAVAALSSGCVENTPVAPESGSNNKSDLSSSAAGASVSGRGNVLRLVGDPVGYEGTVPDIDGDGKDDPAVCFDLDVLDGSGRRVGTATDCLSNITGVGDGLSLVGTTIFRLDNGTFTSRGHTTVQPVTTSEPTPATHTTGAIPMDGANGIIAGTGAYSSYRAQVRLSGAVNLSRLDSEGRIAFDCLFAITPLR